MEEKINENTNQTFERKVKDKNRRIFIFSFIRLGIVFLTFLLIGIYLLSPISSVAQLTITGQIYLQKEDIYEIMNIKNPSKTSLFSLDSIKIQDLLDSHPFIKESKVALNPLGLDIEIVEFAPCAKYGEIYYASTGEEIDNSIMNNESFDFYLSRMKNNIVYFVNEPSINKYFSDYMNIVCKINKKKKCIEFLESSLNEKSFILYYKQDGNSNYFRVNLSYDDQISIDTYINNLVLDEELSRGFEKIINANPKLETKTVLGKEIHYYSIDARLNQTEITIAASKGV